MPVGFSTQPITLTIGFSLVVLVVFWFEYRQVRAKLFEREDQMKQRMYELSILRELGERIGYSLNVKKIVDIISGSIGNLLPYSTVAYMLPTEEGRLTFNIILNQSVSKDFIKDVRSRMVKSASAVFSKKYDNQDVEESVSGVLSDPLSKQKVQSYFNIPIVINEKPAGIFTVSSTEEGLYKTSEDVEILFTIMNQASEAVSKLEQVLEIEKGKLNAMVSSMGDGVLMVDTKDSMIVVNPKTKSLLGIEVKEPTIFEVFDAISKNFDLHSKMKESLEQDKEIIESDIQIGETFLQILISPVKDKKGEPLGTVVLFHDITKEKELEKMREDFTSMMVHELRSPLTGIRSIANLLRKDSVKSEKVKYEEFIGLITQNSSSMLDLVNDLLDVAKLESGKFEIFKNPASLADVIKTRVESLSTLAQDNGISINQSVAPEVPAEFVFDDNKIGQVLNNLLSNAIKFTDKGGTITVSAFICKEAEDIAKLAAGRDLGWPGLTRGAVCPANSVVISVTDSGVGIPKAEIPKLFNKFQQLSTARKSEKKGTGLGLVIIKGVVEAHGGSTGVFSEEGKGSTFYFTLPLVFETPEPLKEVAGGEGKKHVPSNKT